MQNSLKTLDNTRAGGPDDTRELKTPDKPQEEEQEVTTKEKEPLWR